jgi:GNAT superfamily N-acetyltransferase
VTAQSRPAAGTTGGNDPAGPYPLPVSEIVIRPVSFESVVAQQLVAEAMLDLGGRYGGSGDEAPVDATEFQPPGGDFLVAYLDGLPAGCGAWRGHGEVAELKRMYTVPTARGRGIGRAVLAAVERSARDRGRKRMILECGDRQPEAIAMYEACGYERIEDFGHYRDHAGVRSYGRDLSRPPAGCDAGQERGQGAIFRK